MLNWLWTLTICVTGPWLLWPLALLWPVGAVFFYCSPVNDPEGTILWTCMKLSESRWPDCITFLELCCLWELLGCNDCLMPPAGCCCKYWSVIWLCIRGCPFCDPTMLFAVWTLWPWAFLEICYSYAWLWANWCCKCSWLLNLLFIMLAS